jgi:putative aldouronate transport system substrate-binding protein
MALLLALILCTAFTITACSNEPATEDPSSDTATEENAEAVEESNINPAGVFPIAKEAVTLTAFAEVLADITLVDNRAMKFLEDKTNVFLDVLEAPEGEEGQNIKKLLLASGDYPEIFFTGKFSNLDIVNYGVTQQIFMPLNDLIEEYGETIKAVDKEQIPGYLSYVTAPDGNIYGIPDVNQCFHCQSGKSWINTQWLENLGLEYPTTTDELYEVLKAFKTQDPNGNGIADEIPMSGAIGTFCAEPENWLMNSFVYTDYNVYSSTGTKYFVVKDGVVSLAPQDSAYKDGLEYINKLYSEGLIDPAAFTQDLAQLGQLGQNPDVEIAGVLTCGHVGMALDLTDVERSSMYNVLTPVEGPDGVQFSQFVNMNYVQGADFVITDACENPEAAMRLVDYMLTEEFTMINTNGLEGEQWEYAAEGTVDLKGRPATYLKLTNRVETETEARDYLLQFRPRMATDSFRTSNVIASDDIYDPASSQYELRLYQATEAVAPYWPEETLPPLFFSQEESDKLAQLSTNINDYVVQATVRFITGDLDIETGWEEFQTNLTNLGIDEYLAMYQAAYDNYLANAK